MRLRMQKNQTVVLPAVLLVLLGVTVSLGWVFQFEYIVRVLPTLKPMVFATSLCFLVLGINLLSGFYRAQHFTSIVNASTIAFTLLVSCLVLANYSFGVTAYVNFPTFHEHLIKDDPEPGLMGLNTAVCFLLASLALIMTIEQPLTLFRARFVKFAAVLIFIIGFLGFIGYAFNLKELYGWIGAARMALHTAIGMMILGVGLCIKANYQQVKLVEAAKDGESITSVVFFSLLITGISIAAVAYGFLQGRAIDLVKDNYAEQVSERALFFDEIIEHRTKRSTTFLGDDKLRHIAERMIKDQLILADELQEIATIANENEFSAIYLVLDNGIKLPIYVTKFANGKFSIALDGQLNRKLLWDDGFILLSRFKLAFSTGQVDLVFEQPLTILTESTSKWLLKGKSNNQQVCGWNQQELACYPDRYHPEPFIVNLKNQYFQSPALLAINEKSGIKRFFDHVGYQTISSYHPVGKTGLGMVLMVEVREIYSPFIKSFLNTIIFTTAVLIIGFIVIQSKVKPLIQRIALERRAAEKERNRFVIATEGGLDNFFILEAVRNQHQEIIDFKFIYINTSAANLINKNPEELVGSTLFEQLPLLKERRYFGRFKYVIETGLTIAEEIKLNDKSIDATWLYWQIVKLDDGISITARDVTDQHRMMESLAASKERIQQILANQNVATFILDSEHRVTHWNLACEKLTGFPAKRMIGSKESWRGFYQTARPCLVDLVLDNNRDKAAEHYDKQGPSTLLKSGWHAEAWFDDLGGKRRYVIFDAAPIFNSNGKIVAAIETLQDVTETKLAEQALKIEKQNLNSVIEGTNAGTWQWNALTGELKFNQQWAEMLGYKINNIGGENINTWHSLIHPDDFELVQQIKSQHLNGELELFEAEYRMQHRQGHWVWISSRGRLLNRAEQGEPEWMFGTNMDITARKQADEELKKAYTNLEEFTAIASHDLKSPLRGIGDLMEWIQEDLGENIPDEVKNNLQRVQLRVKRMGSLINDLLAYSRAGVVSDDEAMVNVNEMLHEIIELQHIPDKFKVNITCKVKPLRTNETPLKTIIRNLVSNAVKHHDKEVGTINVDVKQKGEFYIFEVLDDGPGIPENVKERVFKLFQTLAKNADSSGVGLAVSKRMAEAHGGHLELESNVEKRVTIFRLFWPKSAHRKLKNNE